MNFRDNLENVRDLYVVLSFISIRENTFYFLVHYNNMEHNFFLFYFFFFFFHIFIHCHSHLSYGRNFKSLADREVSLIFCFRLFSFLHLSLVLFFVFFYIFIHCHLLLSCGPNFMSLALQEVSLIFCFRLFRLLHLSLVLFVFLFFTFSFIVICF